MLILAGWQYVDGYIFPCLHSGCATPENQVAAAINRLRADGAQIGMIWMDIERYQWPANLATNQAFIRSLIHQAQVSISSLSIISSSCIKLNISFRREWA